MTSEKSLQETFAPNNICFGCGPANPKGLRLRSFAAGDELVAEWTPEAHHQAFPGTIGGGIIGTLLDCHSNWTAAWHLMKRSNSPQPPCTVTAEYHVKLLRPSPIDHSFRLVARPVESSGQRVTVEAELISDDKLCATCRGTFVAVKPGHPAFHRW